MQLPVTVEITSKLEPVIWATTLPSVEKCKSFYFTPSLDLKLLCQSLGSMILIIAGTLDDAR
nr:CMF_HP1_G0048390.mRNA.1.CDS.1 [Saccharomyces cerevisiae]